MGGKITDTVKSALDIVTLGAFDFSNSEVPDPVVPVQTTEEVVTTDVNSPENIGGTTDTTDTGLGDVTSVFGQTTKKKNPFDELLG